MSITLAPLRLSLLCLAPRGLPKFNVVVFGSNGPPILEAGYRRGVIPFVRGKVVDAFGEERMVAVQTKFHLVKFVEPECGVLNWF